MLSLVHHPNLCSVSVVLVILGKSVLLRWVIVKNYVLYILAWSVI